MPGRGEGGTIAGDGKDLDGGPEPDAWHRGQDLGKRVGLQLGLEFLGELGALAAHLSQLRGDAGDDPAERVGAGNGHGLLTQRGDDVGWQGLRQPRLTRLS